MAQRDTMTTTRWLGTTGDKVDDYGKGAMGDDNDNDHNEDNDDGDGGGKERRNNHNAHPYF